MSVENIYRLSPMQEGMLFHSLYDAGADPYVDQSVCTLEGDLDAAALRRAWADLGARHQVLRSAFHWRELEHPLQVVFRDAAAPWREKDWRHLDAEARQARLGALLDDDRDRGFDLETPPLMRLTLIREGERRYRFLWTHHHLILDGWSLTVVLRELFAAYEARLRHQAPRLGPPSRPYADYIAWLQGRGLEGAERFWRRALAGFSSPTSPGLAEASPAVAGRRPDPADRELQLPAAATAALAELARRSRVTLGTVVHGAWALLLSRYSGERDVAFGSVVSGRPPRLPGSETMVGLFINTVPVRVRVPPAGRLAAWLADLQQLQLDAREHEHAPLAEVQKWSEVPAGTPLFSTILAFENYPRDPSLWDHTGGLAVRDLDTIERTNYPLSLSIVPEERLWLRLTYDRRRFSAASMRRLLGHLASLLTAMAGSPESRLRELPMLAAGERRQVTQEWSVSAGGEAPGGSLHQLFEARAAADPEAAAVAFEDASGERRTLSYGELERSSARLAAALLARGVTAEVRVGLLLERSPELVVAILAVLRAGGAWVPLDPSYPRPRLSFMVEDAGVALVLATPAAKAFFDAPDAGVRVLTLEELAAEAAATETVPVVLPATDPQQLAYVIYTSGSTGRPKGVMVAHRGAVSLTAVQQRLFGAGPGDRVLLFASPSFDVSVWETWMALTAGATLEVAEPRSLLPGPDLSALLRRRRVTHLTVPPSALAVLPAEPLPDLACLVVAGEACPAEMASRWSPGRRFFNAYGPTEITVCATVEECAPESGPPPIGRPLDRLRVYVLDPDLQPLPAAVAGELYVGGVGVARGYWGRPALTAERFVPDPFAEHAGERLYRTGDRVRWRVDGRLDFLGRGDHQLKVRGFRIEPGEIEAALSAHPRVRESVVVARPAAEGPPRLAAYVAVGSEGGDNDDDDGRELAGNLRELLRRQLPEHMVPAHIVPLAALPRTPAGKVDRGALPAPTAPAAAPAVAGEDLAGWMARLWAEILEVDEVAPDDDFFALGGDSILSIQLLSRLAEKGIHLTPRQVFEHPTPAALAAAAHRAEARQAEQGPVTGPLPLLPVQRWFFARGFADPHQWNMTLQLELPEEVEVSRLGAVLGHLAEHHDALRLRFAAAGDGVRAWIAEPGEPVPLERLAPGPAGDLEAALAELQQSLDLERGPIFKAALVDGGGERPRRLLLVFHHLAVDAVSLGILLADLELAERQLAAGEPVRLPPKTTSVKAWAEALEAAAAEAAAAEAPADGGRSGAEAPEEAAAVALTRDLPGGEAIEADAEQVEVALPAARTALLLTEVHEAYRTRVDEVVLAALAWTFACRSGRPRLWLELEGHGRDALAGSLRDAELDLSRTVGWLTVLTPVLLDLGEPWRRGQAPGEMLKAVKEQLRATLRPAAAPPGGARTGAAAPRPQVLFNYLGRMDRMLAAADRLLPVEGPAGPLRSPRARRPFEIEINAAVLDGRLRLFWTFSPGLHHRATVEAVARGHLEALDEIIGHCLSPAAGGFTPSDFPAADLDQSALDSFLGKLGGGDRR